MMKKSVVTAAIVAALLLIGRSEVSHAAVITLNATDSGNYTPGGGHDSSVKSYLVSGAFGAQRRGYFIFDLSSVTETITNAVLNLSNPTAGGNDATTLSIFEVTTPTGTVSTAFVDPNSTGADVYTDLGDGTAFGSLALAALAPVGVYDVVLNGAAVSALDAATGLFAMGSTIGSGSNNSFFVDSVLAGATLTLTTSAAAAIPEPSSLVCLAGLAAVVGFRRLRNSRC